MTLLDDDLDLALSAAREAGEVAMRYFRGDFASWEKGPGQIVTDADIEIDALLKERLLKARPGDGWLSEETEDDPVRLGHRRVWVVDPIDGTRSFNEGTPEFSVSVALVEDGRTLAGVVLNPAKGEEFAAVRGRGATLNGEPVRAAARTSLEGARIVVSKFENRRRGFEAMLPSVELVTIGSLAYKLALVACGRFDGYVSWRRSQDWDIAAAALLLEEAGAALTDADGRPVVFNLAGPMHDGLVAGPPPLHAALLQATGAARREHVARRDAGR